MIVFTGGPVLTMTGGPPAEVLVVGEDGRIAAVGGTDLLDRYPGAEVIDRAGRTLCPGFVDAHHHLSIAALHPLWADLRGAGTPEEVGRRLAAVARRDPEATWVRGWGWSDLDHPFVPHRRELDALGLDRPVLVAHYSLHQGVVDSRGLAELGLGRTSPDPPGGEIGRDPDGEPNGLLTERAWGEAHARSLAPYDDPDRWADHIEARARSLLADGITAVHDAACSPAAEAAYARLASVGRLPVSVLAMPHPAALFGPPGGRLDGPPTGEGDERLRVGPLKLFADGGIAPALDVHLGGAPLRYGHLFEGLEDQVRATVERGFDVAVHAIGNAGLAVVLEVWRSRAGAGRRLRVEHACLAGPDQIRAMAELGVAAVVQPGFLHHLGGQVEEVHFDDAEWLPFGDLARAGVPLAASSDDPCTFHEPLRTSAHGATRRTAKGGVLDIGQALGYERWLEAYTAGAADAGGQGDERGRLAPGLRADLVVLDGPLDPESPPTVAETWVGGRRVFSAPPAGPQALDDRA